MTLLLLLLTMLAELLGACSCANTCIRVMACPRSELLTFQGCCRVQFADSNQTVFRELNIQELPPPEGMKINEMRCEC